MSNAEMIRGAQEIGAGPMPTGPRFYIRWGALIDLGVFETLG